MKDTFTSLTPGILILMSFSAASGQYAPPPPPAPFPGFLNEALRKDDPYMAKWDLGGNDRLRYEAKQGFAIPGKAGSVDFRDHGADANNDYFLNKLRVHVGYTDKWWNAYVEARSSIASSDERFAYANAPAVTQTIKRQGDGPESDTLDLHQAYVTLGNHKEFPVSLKLGRQELSYGEERLIGAFGWNNIGRVFDAAKARWQNAWFAADIFTSRPVIPVDGKFNVENDYEWFSGIYLTTTKVPDNTLELYILSRNVGRNAIRSEVSPQFPQPTARDIYTFGGRLKSLPDRFGKFDYTLEGAYQTGDFAATATSKRLDQDAFMVSAQGGYTFGGLWASPRLGAEYSFSSGDSNPNDGKHQTFDNLFPTNHKFYGYMDFLSLQNIHNIRGIFQLKPTPRFHVALEGHGFWLADTRDYFYNVGGGPRTTGGYGLHPTYSNFVGTECDIIAGYAVSRFAQLEVGYGHFFTGSYIQQSLAAPTAGSRDADYLYLQTTIAF